MQKRGVSEVITSVLLILLAVAAVIIVWGVIKGVIEKSTGEVDLSSIVVSMEVERVTYNSATDTAQVVIKRGAGEGEINKIKIVFSNDAGQNYVFTTDTGLDVLQTDTFNVIDIPNTLNPTKVEIYPVFVVNGRDKVGILADSSSVVGGIIGCSDECTSGTRCLDSDTRQTCGDYDTDTCLEWGGNVDCSGATPVCSAGSCVAAPTCPDGTCATGEACSADCSTETYCSDSVDNDVDTFTDCADSDCSTDPACTLEEIIETIVGTSWDYKFGGIYYKAEPFSFVTGNLYPTQFCFKNIRKSSTATTFGDITVEIRTVTGIYNVPTETILASATISQASVSTTSAQVCADFASPSLLTQNTVYTMVASSASSEDQAYEWGRGGELYGGTAFRPSRKDVEGNWLTMGSNVDFAFKIVGSPTP